MNLLQGKTALVTGGSRGIGKAIALKFASEGASIAFTATSISTKALSTLEEIRAFGVRAEAYECNASNFEATQTLVAKVIEDFGHIDILVNNAGIARDTFLMRMSEEQWDEVINVNLKGAFNTCHAVVPAMIHQRSGSIINISSVVGIAGNAGQANYAASKAGLIGFSKSLAKEIGSRGVRVNCIAPGFIASDMTCNVPEEIRQTWLPKIFLHHEGSPEDVANAALFLASDMASYITAQVLCVSGGMDC